MSKKSNKKQTAVDFLVEQLLKKSDIQHINGFEALVEQAKAMEENQHQITFDMGYEEHIVETWGEEDPKGFKDYFTETYKS